MPSKTKPFLIVFSLTSVMILWIGILWVGLPVALAAVSKPPSDEIILSEELIKVKEIIPAAPVAPVAPVAPAAKKIIPAATATVDAPSNLTISARSACAIDASWEPSPTPNIYYYLEYTTRTDFSVPAENHLAVTTPSLSYEHAGLPLNSGRNYSYRLKAVQNSNPGIYSEWVFSNPTSINTLPLAAPADPSGLSASGKSGGQQVDLIWQNQLPVPSESYGGFEIWRGTTPTNLGLIDISPTPNLFNGFYTGPSSNPFLDPGQIYYYKVRNFESDYGCASASKLYSGFSAVVKVPAMPNNLTAGYDSQNKKITLNWTAGAGQDYYQISRAISTNPPDLYTTTINSFDDFNPTSNEKYTYEVRGCTASGGCSAFSNMVSVTVTDAPQNFTARLYYADTATTEGKVYLAWDDTFPGNDDYIVERAAPGESFSEIQTVPSNLVEYRDENIPLGQNYTYRVRSRFGSNSYSNYSLPASVNLNIQLSLEGTAWAMMAGGGNAVGWVDFNSGQTAANPYSVQVDSDGLMSGAAWSSIDGKGYGWLSFNKSDLTGCPLGTCEARFSSSPTGGALSGWARFISTAGNPSGWDGWVSLRGVNNTVSPAVSWGVSYDPGSGNFIGAAWGSDMTGWFAFTTDCGSYPCTVRGVVAIQLPVVTDVKISWDPNAWCSEFPAYRITWSYTDASEKPQQSAEIKISGSSFSTFIKSIATNDTSYIQNQDFVFSNPLNDVPPSTQFSVAVRASNGAVFSNWTSSGNSPTTPSHYYPFVDFTWTPASHISVGTILKFTDTSLDRSGGAYPIQSRLWTFTGGNPIIANGSPVSTVVRQLPLDASLMVTDTSNNSCVAETTIESDGSGSGVGQKRRIFREL